MLVALDKFVISFCKKISLNLFKTMENQKEMDL